MNFFKGLIKGKKEQRIFTTNDEIRIALLGKTGAGKSETGNTILGSHEFESKDYGVSVTKECGISEAIRGDKKVVLVDTPGLFDTELPLEVTKKEVMKCVGMTSPGVHCFLLVVQVGRFTKEEKNTIEALMKMFGNEAQRYLIVLFTKVDTLNGDESIEVRFKRYLENTPDTLQKFLAYCDNRCIGFNNRERNTKKRKEQVDKLFQLITETVDHNGGSCYTSEMYEETEKKIQEAIERKRQEEERNAREKRKKMEDEIAKEIEKEQKKKKIEALEKMKKEMEEERARSEEELRKKLRMEIQKEDPSWWSQLVDGITSFFSFDWL